MMFKRWWRQNKSRERPKTGATPFLHFESRAPSNQTAVDLFRDRWASDLSSAFGVDGTGAAKLFTDDKRPLQAAVSLGLDRRLDGMLVLELGPLEAAHTYALERLGASVVAVECNGEAFLKCLVVKELTPLKASRFLLGDAIEFLKAETGRYDLVLCSGILYHMADPLRLIELISKVTDKCFVWTHYYSEQRRSAVFRPVEAKHAGFSATYWTQTYGDRSKGFWGGNKSDAVWMEREVLFAAFAHFGFGQVVFTEEMPDHPNGAAISFAVKRAG
jgi:hypothetical protein